MELIRTPKVENVRMLDRLTTLISPSQSQATSGVQDKSTGSGSSAIGISYKKKSGTAQINGKSSSTGGHNASLVLGPGGGSAAHRGSQGTLGSGSTGTLYLTASHLIFINHTEHNEQWILHHLIASVEKLPTTTLGCPLFIRCKHFLNLTFIIPRERDAHDIYLSLTQLSQPPIVERLYCFDYSARDEPDMMRDELDSSKGSTSSENGLESISANKVRDGWDFSMEQEYKRLGLPNEQWVISNSNIGYGLCATYPEFLAVPAGVDRRLLDGSARFRSKERLPVMTYYHAASGAALCRCAQPLVGLSGRSADDELLIAKILAANVQNNNVLYIVDTRPRMNAMVNKAVGKGCENETNYENTKYYFYNIENIHVMRSSLAKLMDACELRVPSMNAFLTSLESSGWLRHVKVILETGQFIAQSLAAGISVAVHCSDGWDRTSQTCSLAQLMLHPHYRTVDGFRRLIEKDWLAFGHKFTDRCGHVLTSAANSGEQREMAPVFTQFLDAVWQMTHQWPQLFEFNERYLLTLHDHVFSCQFGTFIGNCDRERSRLRLAEKTFSFWSYVRSHRAEFLNPLYRPPVDLALEATTMEDQINRLDLNSSNLFSGMLDISVAPQAIKFWRALYNKFDYGVHPRESLDQIVLASLNHITKLESQIERMRTLRGHLADLRGSTTPSSNSSCSLDRRGQVKRDNQKQQQQSITATREQSSTSIKSNNKSDVTCSHHPLTDGFLPNGNENNNDLKNGTVAARGGGDEPSEDLALDLREVEESLGGLHIDWQSLRDVKECTCSTVFNFTYHRIHCWNCGQIFCIRCMKSDRATRERFGGPVCEQCYK